MKSRIIAAKVADLAAGFASGFGQVSDSFSASVSPVLLLYCGVPVQRVIRRASHLHLALNGVSRDWEPPGLPQFHLDLAPVSARDLESPQPAVSWLMWPRAAAVCIACCCTSSDGGLGRDNAPKEVGWSFQNPEPLERKPEPTAGAPGPPESKSWLWY